MLYIYLSKRFFFVLGLAGYVRRQRSIVIFLLSVWDNEGMAEGQHITNRIEKCRDFVSFTAFPLLIFFYLDYFPFFFRNWCIFRAFLWFEGEFFCLVFGCPFLYIANMDFIVPEIILNLNIFGNTLFLRKNDKKLMNLLN